MIVYIKTYWNHLFRLAASCQKRSIVSTLLGCIFVPVFMALVGCSGNVLTNSTNPSSALLSKSDVLSSITESVVLPNLEALLSSSEALNESVFLFTENPTTDTLLQAQNAWKTAQLYWQTSLGVQFGPFNDYESKIHFWPKRPSSIEDVLNGTDPLSLESVALMGVTRKGLPVLEYLLFDHVNGNAHIVSLFQSDERRREYATLLAQDLVQTTSDLYTAWSPESGNYAGSFVMSSNGFNMLVNQLVFAIENVKHIKIGKPLGKNSGGSPRPADVESQQSEQSWSHIRHNLEGVRNAFNGMYAASNGTSSEPSPESSLESSPESSLQALAEMVNGPGLDDYLIEKGHFQLNTDIQAQFQLVLAHLDNVTIPLWRAVTETPAPVEGVYTDLTKLLRLIKVDLSVAINETIHFNDSDGD